MTSASKSRVARRAAEKALAGKLAFKPGDAPKSVITLTETPEGGFTIGLGLHGARMEELQPGVAHNASIVDIMALTISTLIRQKSKVVEETFNLVAQTVHGVNKKLAEGASVEDALGDANEKLDGAVADVEALHAPANDQPQAEA